VLVTCQAVAGQVQRSQIIKNSINIYNNIIGVVAGAQMLLQLMHAAAAVFYAAKL
jgi:hypothetical protein